MADGLSATRFGAKGRILVAAMQQHRLFDRDDRQGRPGLSHDHAFPVSSFGALADERGIVEAVAGEG